MNSRLLLLTLQDTVHDWSRLRIPKLGAALAYYTAFSLAPLLVLLLSLSGLLMRRDFARHAIILQINNLIGQKGSQAIQEIITHSRAPHLISWETGVSFGILVFSAAGAFCELQDSLNQIWDAPVQEHPIRTFFRGHLLSLVMILVLGFFMLLSLLISTILTQLDRLMNHVFPVEGWEVVNFSMSFLIIASLFAVMYRMLPSVSLRWAQVWPGAILSSFLFAVGKFLIGWYLVRGNLISNYGSTGSLLVILIWVFYSAQILYLGAIFNRVLHRRFALLSEKQAEYGDTVTRKVVDRN